MHDSNIDPPTVRLISRSYRPNKAALVEDLRVDASLEELGNADIRRVRLKFHKPAPSTRQ